MDPAGPLYVHCESEHLHFLEPDFRRTVLQQPTVPIPHAWVNATRLELESLPKNAIHVPIIAECPEAAAAAELFLSTWRPTDSLLTTTRALDYNYRNLMAVAPSLATQHLRTTMPPPPRPPSPAAHLRHPTARHYWDTHTAGLPPPMTAAEPASAAPQIAVTMSKPRSVGASYPAYPQSQRQTERTVWERSSKVKRQAAVSPQKNSRRPSEESPEKKRDRRRDKSSE